MSQLVEFVQLVPDALAQDIVLNSQTAHGADPGAGVGQVTSALEESLQPLPGIAEPVVQLRQEAPPRLAIALHQGSGQLLLGGEMVVDARLGNPQTLQTGQRS